MDCVTQQYNNTEGEDSVWYRRSATRSQMVHDLLTKSRGELKAGRFSHVLGEEARG